MTSTPATEALRRAGVAFTSREYQPIEEAEGTYGEAIAALLGVEPARVFKTLVTVVDDRPTVAVVPVSGHLSLKALARARGAKRAEMADPAQAERLTGYVVGGISPFGQKRRLEVVVDATVLDHPTVLVSGGRRGLQVELAPADLVRLLGATVAGIASG
ncbi:MAG: Cys-tRNA(Pro) deacylase [Acidimicrobiia bacterium]|jgi:Cys-tRNA(Pro)/Cys-tRNA(Cys) deacylase|nr:Cys-tRNA(Pro) deacylase [Acidimicrobiia bacterium]